MTAWRDRGLTALRRFEPATTVGLVTLAATLGLIGLTPLLPGYDPFTQHLPEALTPPLATLAHPLGTDPLGRDLLSRLALAGRTSAAVAVLSLALSLTLGASLGLVAGYFGGVLDAVVSGIGELQLCLPILLFLAMVAAVVGPSAPTLVAVLGCTTWVGYARVCRLAALRLRQREFVLAARVQGASSLWILRHHLAPHVVSQLAILAAYNLGVLVILESGLSYLGLGVPAPTPSWGAMINQGQDFLQTAPWLCLFPGLAIFLLVGGVQVLSQRLTAESGTELSGGA